MSRSAFSKRSLTVVATSSRMMVAFPRCNVSRHMAQAEVILPSEPCDSVVDLAVTTKLGTV